MSAPASFGFQPLPNHRFPGYEKNSTQDLLMKWSLQYGMKLQAFAFDRPYKTYLDQEFVQDFLSNSAVISTLECQKSPEHGFAPIGIPAESIELEQLKCSLTSMSLFDRLSENDTIVRQSGSIKKCMDEYYSSGPDFDSGDGNWNQIEVSDELRKMLLCKDSEHADLFSKEEQSEFLFRIFKHLVIGGSLCQYEDNLSPYLETTKVLYKDLVGVSVGQEADGKSNLIVNSSVIQVLGAKCDSYDPTRDLIFYRPHLNNFFYLIVDSYKRVVYTVYHHA